MTDLEAIQSRHSVRQYRDEPIDPAISELLAKKIKMINAKTGLHFQLVLNEPRAFSSMLAKYGRFRNVSNYIVCAGKQSEKLDEQIGYYGEQLVLLAQKLGLNTCWVGLTFKKVPGTFSLRPDDRFVCVIALGYGAEQGHPHKSKSLNQIADISQAPSWFLEGAEAALLAPTAINQQKFHFSMENGKVKAAAKRGPMSKIDLGIARLHFEIGAKKDSSVFADQL